MSKERRIPHEFEGEQLESVFVGRRDGAARPTVILIPTVMGVTDLEIGFGRQLVELGYLDTAHTMGGASVAFNVQPRATGQLLIGSSRELVGWDPGINREVMRAMLRRAVEFLPRLPDLSQLRAMIDTNMTGDMELPTATARRAGDSSASNASRA